jgi:hypothetical protein
MIRRAVLLGLLATGAAVASAAPAASASAPADPIPSGATVVTVTMTRSAMTLSTDKITAGNTVLKAVSGDGKDHEVQIVRLHRGYSFAQFIKDVNGGFNSGDVNAIRRVDANASFRGGAEAHYRPGYMSVPLKAGRYSLLDIDGGTAQPLTVTGAPVRRPVPRTHSTITAFTYGFGVTGTLPHQGWIHEHNTSDQPHFYVFNRVKPDTTNAEVKQYFQGGGQGKPSFALFANISSGVISPDTGQNFYMDLPAGRYVVACFWPDDDTGMPHAMMGMWKLITLR